MHCFWQSVISRSTQLFSPRVPGAGVVIKTRIKLNFLYISVQIDQQLSLFFRSTRQGPGRPHELNTIQNRNQKGKSNTLQTSQIYLRILMNHDQVKKKQVLHYCNYIFYYVNYCCSFDCDFEQLVETKYNIYNNKTFFYATICQ